MQLGYLLFAFAAYLLLAPIEVFGQCDNSPNLGQAVTCLQVVLGTKVDKGYVDNNYSKTADLNTKLNAYVTNSTLQSKAYVTNTTLQGKAYVAKTDLDNTLKNYVSVSTLEPYAKSATGDF